MENHEEEQVETVSVLRTLLPEEEVNAKTRSYLNRIIDLIDSPKTQFILRSAILTLLELPEPELNGRNVARLLTEDQYRADVVQRLTETTPQRWSEEWDSAWRKDAEPMLSKAQQRFAKRTSLITFWTKEWEMLPDEIKAHLRKIAGSLR